MDLSNSQSLLHYRTQISTTILQTLRQREGGRDMEREGGTWRERDRQTNRQTDRQTETDTERHRHTETQTETELENFILHRSRFIQKPV